MSDELPVAEETWILRDPKRLESSLRNPSPKVRILVVRRVWKGFRRVTEVSFRRLRFLDALGESRWEGDPWYDSAIQIEELRTFLENYRPVTPEY